MKNEFNPFIKRRELIMKSIDVMKEDILKNVETDLDGLILQSKMPQRTFYYNFKQMTGESPKRYFKNLKLKKIQEELVAAKKGVITIQEIASLYGFTHMGQFSQDYKNVIGELPSESFRKNLNIAVVQQQEK
jgi:AraC family transcriptional regulator, ethanolamine operon transcriptional activator